MSGVVDSLTLMQRQFFYEYIKESNATQAARVAGYSNPDKAGSRLLKNRKIRFAIDDYFREEEMTAKEVIKRLSEQARALYSAFLNDDGTVDLKTMLNAGMGHLIKKYTNTQHGLTVEFYDAQTALIQVGRYHRIFTDGLEHHGAVPIQFIEPILSEEPELDEDE